MKASMRAQGYGLTVQAQDAIQAIGVDISQDDAPSTSHYTFSDKGEIIGFLEKPLARRARIDEKRKILDDLFTFLGKYFDLE